MTPDEVTKLFTRADDSFAFARWGRPIAPIIFGVEEKSLPTIKGAIEAVATLADHEMAEVDTELGANLMFFFFRDWKELLEVPILGKLVPDLGPLVERLINIDANQYRFFRFDDQGGIQAAFVFLRMDEHLAAVPAETLALSQAVQTIVLWSDTAFQDRSPLVTVSGTTVLRPDIAALIRAAYDPVLPASSNDPSHALRVAARMERLQ